MSLRDKVKRAYLLKQSQRQHIAQTQPQPAIALNDILWFREQMESGQRVGKPRPRLSKKVLEVLQRVRKY